MSNIAAARAFLFVAHERIKGGAETVQPADWEALEAIERYVREIREAEGDRAA